MFQGFRAFPSTFALLVMQPMNSKTFADAQVLHVQSFG